MLEKSWSVLAMQPSYLPSNRGSAVIRGSRSQQSPSSAATAELATTLTITVAITEFVLTAHVDATAMGADIATARRAAGRAATSLSQLRRAAGRAARRVG